MGINLKDVTLVVVTSVKIQENVKSLVKSMQGIEYGSVKFISHERPHNLPLNVEYVSCNYLDYTGFSRFTFHELYKYVDTSHCLLVHHDGFVTDPHLWEEEFLKFDYIGAPWVYLDDVFLTDYGEHVRVGNAGFCLRSRKLLEMPTKLGLDLQHRQGWYNDDGNYCVYHRKTFLENGIKYAPIEVAARFSTECYIKGITNEHTFGFHGAGNPKVSLLNSIII